MWQNIYLIIIHKLNSLNLRSIATAFSGITLTLLLGGKTLHSVFKLRILLLANSLANITANSSYGRYINSSSLIIIDEVSMCPLQVLKIIDRLLCGIYAMKMININQLEEKRYFCVVIFSKSYQVTHIHHVVYHHISLVLKVKCIVLLIRNLNTKKTLVDGTRICKKFMH